MQEIITSLTGKYGLTTFEVMAEVETVFSAILSKWHGFEVMVFFRDLKLEAVAYNNSGGVIMQQPVDLLKIKGRNTIIRELEVKLSKVAVLKKVARYKPFEKVLLWGEITAVDAEHNFFVEIEFEPSERITAICPLNRIGLHERHSNNLSVGRKRAFHLRRVEPVMLNGTPRLKVVVDRVSKTLVENLLKSQLGGEAEKFGIKCVKRYVGHKSVVLTSKRLPKSAIVAVDRELHERVVVRFANMVNR